MKKLAISMLIAALTLLGCGSDDRSTEVSRSDESTFTKGVFTAPNGTESFAQKIIETEKQIRESEEASEGSGFTQQLLYRALAKRPDSFAEETLALVKKTDASLGAAAELNLSARNELLEMDPNSRVPQELPGWTIVDPAPADELISYYKAAEDDSGIDWEILAGINLVETRMGRIDGVSSAGAIGPMQFLPTTWAECCEGDPLDPKDAIAGAAKYLVHRGGLDDISKGLWGYNNSYHYGNAVMAYAEVIRQDEQAYYGYHNWQVLYKTTSGVVRLPSGYSQGSAIPIEPWLTNNRSELIDLG